VLAYTQTHFKTEEELFSIHPNYQEHKVFHQRLIDQMLALSRDVQNDKADTANALLAYLTQWLKSHILNTDISFFADLCYRPRKTREDLEERLALLTHKEQILIVEDSPVERRLMRENLERDGFSVLEATNGSEALRILEEHFDIHLVVTDISMPVMDGFQLIQAIRDNQSLVVYLIILTDSANKDSLVQAFSLGANDFITKPVFHPELSLRIRNGLSMLQIKSQDELIFSMAKLADCRSPETGNHLDRSVYSPACLADSLSKPVLNSA
jgi:CheY-like chemotaxis protein